MLIVIKDLGSLRLPLSAFEASQLVDFVAISYMLMARDPKH